MKVRRVAKKYQRVEYHIDNSSNWDDFESLIKFAEKKYPSAMTKNRDGAYMNGFLIKEDGVEVVFFHLSGFGTVFYSKDGLDHPVLKKIADDLMER